MKFIMVMLMVTIVTGLLANPQRLSPQEQEVLNYTRAMRLVPTPSGLASKRALVLSEYIDQDYEGDWVNSSKVLIEYDNQLRPLMLFNHYWDDFSGTWSESSRETATYSANGRPLEVVEEWFDGMEWIAENRVDFTWEANKLQSVKHWALYGEEPVLTMEQTLSYNIETDRLEYLVNSFNMWDRFWTTRINFTWDEQGRAMEVFGEMELESMWLPYFRTVISYLPQDQSNYDSYYNFLIKQLTFGDHELHHMYAQILVQEEQEYDQGEEMAWELTGKYTYHYDAGLNLLQMKYFYLDAEDWVISEQEEYTYDEFGNPLSWTAYDVWDTELSPWTRRLNTYSEASSTEDNVNPIAMVRVRVFPNPFNPETNIAFELSKSSPVSLDIFNVKGQKVRNLVSELKQAGSHQIVFDGKDSKGRALNSGMYFVRLKTNEGSSTRKLILQK